MRYKNTSPMTETHRHTRSPHVRRIKMQEFNLPGRFSLLLRLRLPHYTHSFASLAALEPPSVLFIPHITPFRLPMLSVNKYVYAKTYSARVQCCFFCGTLNTRIRIDTKCEWVDWAADEDDIVVHRHTVL